MEVETKELHASGVKLFVIKDDKEIGRAYLYLLTNDIHKKPFGFMEDVFVDEEHRKSGIGTLLVNALIDEAKKRGCYKVIGTSRLERPKVHELYTKIGFKDWGKEFRLDL